ncbi:hypothetical protein BS47DRAFT_901517 [Hydnum rufescens UP504]|uniref:Uncharacterized protein n=1 Tax=Hydnum rufescens UP504 TaxID=1448309 RepID=A0A9P6AY59_9AGAM|nr:hypothetical protein BS47DRAFT_901517 [Hydnum rufescens UP504]
MSASSSSLSPPVQLRPRGSSVSGGLSLHSLAPRQQQPTIFPPTPQTPSSLIRKDTSSSIPVRFNPQARMFDEHPGSPHRPMLSVLLSLSVAALPPFVRPYGRAPRSRTRSPRSVSRVWVP